MKNLSQTLIALLTFLVATFVLQQRVSAQAADTIEPTQAATTVESSATDSKKALDPETEKLYEKFQQNLTGTKFIGQFTITGKESEKPREEEYTITKVKKLPKDDLWEITSRIKYGDHDITVPMVMAVKWAGKTPVITVDRLFIPAMGTFDARVLLRKDKYAGTWAHGKVGGHLFGRIEKIETSEKQTEK